MNFKVYIIILNWNGWKDTIECLESVFRNAHSNYQVIVCDNNSSDGSLERIKEWANGRITAQQSSDKNINKFTNPIIQKPIRYIEYYRKEVENNCIDDRQSQLILIENGENLGFSGGNNIGIKYALQKDDFEFVWLLNNDTVIHPDSLSNLIRSFRKENKVGIVGSTLCYYNNPEIVQGIGGILNTTLLITKPACRGIKLADMHSRYVIDCAVGASFMISREFIQKMGMLSEDYFLYYEELDLAKRAKKAGFLVRYSLDSIVYHKQGCSTKNNSSRQKKSDVGLYHGTRSRILYAKKFYVWLTPIIVLSNIVPILNRLRKRDGNILPIIKGILSGIMAEKSSENKLKL